MKTQGIHRAATAERGGADSTAASEDGRSKRRGRGRRGARGHGAGRGRGHERHGCDRARDGAGELGARPTATSIAPLPAAPRPEITTKTASASATATPATAPSPATGPITTTPAATSPAAGGDVGDQLVAQVAGELGGSPMARQVLSLVAQGDASVDVLDDATFSQRYGAAKGIYDPRTKRIQLPQSITADPQLLRIVLLHEGMHWLQDNAPGGIEQLGGPLVQALRGAGALGHGRASHHDEAQAFVLEALVAQELGIEDPGMGTGDGGRVLGYDQVLARVRATPAYG